jgi:hypothetical protein
MFLIMLNKKRLRTVKNATVAIGLIDKKADRRPVFIAGSVVCPLASVATEEQKEQPLNTHLTDGDDLEEINKITEISIQMKKFSWLHSFFYPFHRHLIPLISAGWLLEYENRCLHFSKQQNNSSLCSYFYWDL